MEEFEPTDEDLLDVEVDIDDDWSDLVDDGDIDIGGHESLDVLRDREFDREFDVYRAMGAGWDEI